MNFERSILAVSLVFLTSFSSAAPENSPEHELNANPIEAQSSSVSLANDHQAMQAGFDLIDAARIGDITRATELLQVRGIDLELGKKFCTNTTLTALSAAADKGHVLMVELLLDNRALIDNCDYIGLTPLIRASKRGHDRVVELLLQRGAKVDLEDKRYKDTALNGAILNRHKKVVLLLLKAKADVNKIGNGHTPLQNAENFPEIKEIIESFMNGDEMSDSTLSDTVELSYDLIQIARERNNSQGNRSNLNWNSIPKGHFSQLFLTLTPPKKKTLIPNNRAVEPSSLSLESHLPDSHLPYTYLPPTHILKADEIQNVIVPQNNLAPEVAHRFRLNRIFYSILSAKYNSANYHRLSSGRTQGSEDMLILPTDNPSQLSSFFSDDEELVSQALPSSTSTTINLIRQALKNEFPDPPRKIDTEKSLDNLQQLESTLGQISNSAFDKISPYVDRYIKDSHLLIKDVYWNHFVLYSIDRYLEKHPTHKKHRRYFGQL